MGNAGSSRPKFAPYIMSTAIAASFGLSTGVHAATAALEEVIVTAQKREQSVQEVPVAITAMTQASLETNRVANVTDLSGLAPNLTARPSAGGVGVASFSMRGVTSYGVVPGSDREISIYLDGVYVGSPRGTIFNLPDISQLEVLRGPQGTLFGRNATAGAINVTTHDPAGEFGLRQDLSYGNHAYRRTRTSVDSPTWGPFSFAATYAKEQRDGDVKNLGGGTVWSDTNGNSYVSPKTLGDKNNENYFFAAKFQPVDTFTMTFKADKSTDHGTPDAIAPVAIGSVASAGFVAGNLVSQIYNTNPSPLTTNGKRPDAVNNEFDSGMNLTVVGYSLTTAADVNDQVSLKNITAFRSTQLRINTDITGLGGVTSPANFTGFAPIPLPASTFGQTAGAPVCIVCTQGESDSDQWSSELQVNYETDWVTLTVGALYYESEDRTGGPLNSVNTIKLTSLPNHVISGPESISFNNAQSTAIYSQGEFHLTDTVDLVAGVRETRDRKSGDYRNGSQSTPTDVYFNYAKTTPSYMLGVNYKPTYDTLIYAKLSSAFVSGGSVGGVTFDPEKAKSWEAGIKSDFLDSRLRSNLSVFYTNYDNIQSSASGVNVGHPNLGTLIIGQGSEAAKGFEWEGSASVGGGVTLNASVGYTSIHFGSVDPVLQASVVSGSFTSNQTYLPTLTPRWTGNVGAQYESDPLFNQSYVGFNVGGSWHSTMQLLPNRGFNDGNPAFAEVDQAPASWIINSRLALKKIDLGFAGAEGEVALWGRNLTDNKYPSYALNFGGLAVSANYLQARSYGVDLSVKF